MKLYVTVNSPYARIARIAVIETGLEASVEQRVLTRDQLYSDTSEVLQVNPTGKVPTLVLDSGVVLTECKQVLDYIDAVTGAKLAVRDGADGWRDLARLGQSFALLDAVVTWLRAAMAGGQEAVIARERPRIDRILNAVEGEISPLGETTSGFQIVLATALGLEARLPAWDWRTGRSDLARWYDRISQRPAFRATAPDPV